MFDFFRSKGAYLFSLIIIVTLVSCGENESETYLGAYRTMDRLIPYPYIISAKNDSLAIYNGRGELYDKIDKEKIYSFDTLKFSNKHLYINKENQNEFWAYDLLDTINFKQNKNGIPGLKYAAKFHKLEGSVITNFNEIKANLVENVWKYKVFKNGQSNPNEDFDIFKTLGFKKDSIYIMTDYYYQNQKIISEYEVKKFSLLDLNAHMLLSFENGIDNPQPIFQILNNASDSLALKDFRGIVPRDIILEKQNTSRAEFHKNLKDIDLYSNCYDGYQGEYYFGDDVTYRKGNKYIIEHVSKNLPVFEKKSGYVIVHFTINCKGKLGDFGLIQMNKMFKKTIFSSEMVKHIIQKVSYLEDWPSTKSTLKWINYEDVHGFLMFKIENGKITDLCP